MTADDELKGPDFGNATEKTEKYAEFEKHDESWQTITNGSKQPDEYATDDTPVF